MSTTTTTTDELLTVAEAARRIGVNKSTLHRQVHNGSVRSHGGRVRLAEVIEDRARNLDPHNARGGKPPAPTPPTVDAYPGDVDDPDADDAPIGDGATLNDARRLKEIELARLRRLERLQIEGKLVDAETVRSAVFNKFRNYRDQIQGWPSRVAPELASELGVEAGVLLVALEAHLRSFLTQLTAPQDHEIVRPK